jgi:hypothetical protein
MPPPVLSTQVHTIKLPPPGGIQTLFRQPPLQHPLPVGQAPPGDRHEAQVPLSQMLLQH